MEKPLVSIVTPCYNGESFLERYFETILAQTYSNLELIFVNDGSIDKTEEIALSYTDRLKKRGIKYIYIKQENAGQAAALNRGLKIFSGDYLTWPDSDDVMTPECIEKKVEFLEKYSEYGMVRSDGKFFDEITFNTTNIAKEKDKMAKDIFEELLLVKTYGCCGCYMIRKSLFLECYPDRDIYESRIGQNWQVLVPAASRTLCGYINESLYIVYERRGSHSRSEQEIHKQYLRWELFTEVLLNSLKASCCDQKRCFDLVKENNARQQFYIAVSVRDKRTMKSSLKKICTHGKVTVRECLLFFKCLFF